MYHNYAHAIYICADLDLENFGYHYYQIAWVDWWREIRMEVIDWWCHTTKLLSTLNLKIPGNSRLKVKHEVLKGDDSLVLCHYNIHLFINTHKRHPVLPVPCLWRWGMRIFCESNHDWNMLMVCFCDFSIWCIFLSFFCSPGMLYSRQWT